MRRLVLVGGGHAHVQVLRDWIEQPVPGVEVVVVSPTRVAPYSGMVPGWLEGRYAFDEIGIDVAALAHAAAARFVEDDAVGIDADRSIVFLRDSEPLPFDVASLNIGSTLFPPAGRPGEWLSLRPLGALRPAWEALLARLALDDNGGHGDGKPRRVVAAGGGPAGVESVLAVLTRLRTLRPKARHTGLIATLDADVLPTHAPSVRHAMRHVLEAAGVEIATNVDANAIETRTDDIVLWATGAQAHRWPSESSLAVDARGFVRVDATLCSPSHPNVFAVGDCASWVTPLPKAGVIPVRQGPVLSRNLRAALHGNTTLEAYRPQRRHLALLATGDGRAVASWGPFTANGTWVWQWKDHIDRRFVRQFAVPRSALP